MGKGKSSFAKRLRVKTKTPVPKLDTEFTCPFCNSHKSVQCTIPRIKMMERESSSIGLAECSICNASYRTSTTHLTNPIDIYSEWLDECERVNGSHEDHQAVLEPRQSRPEWTPPRYDWLMDDEEDEEDDVMPPAKVPRRMK